MVSAIRRWYLYDRRNARQGIFLMVATALCLGGAYMLPRPEETGPLPEPTTSSWTIKCYEARSLEVDQLMRKIAQSQTMRGYRYLGNGYGCNDAHAVAEYIID